jgi:hypothetical protein
MGVLADKAALVTGGSCGIDEWIRGAPDPDGAAVVLSFVCNRTPLSRSRWRRRRLAAGGDLWRGQGQRLSGGRNSVDGMSVDLLAHENRDRRCGL